MSSPLSSPEIGRRMPRLADAALTRARLTVVPRARSRAPKVPFVLLVSLLLVGGVVGLLMFNTSMQQSSFAAARLEERAVALTAEEQSLTMQVESMRNPQRVAEQAQAMGMVLPTASCFLVLGGAQPECAPAPAPERLQLQPAAPVKPAILDPAPITVPAPSDATDVSSNGRRDKSREDTGSASPGTGSTRGRNDGTAGQRRTDGVRR